MTAYDGYTTADTALRSSRSRDELNLDQINGGMVAAIEDWGAFLADAGGENAEHKARLARASLFINDRMPRLPEKAPTDAQARQLELAGSFFDNWRRHPQPPPTQQGYETMATVCGDAIAYLEDQFKIEMFLRDYTYVANNVMMLPEAPAPPLDNPIRSGQADGVYDAPEMPLDVTSRDEYMRAADYPDRVWETPPRRDPGGPPEPPPDPEFRGREEGL